MSLSSRLADRIVRNRKPRSRLLMLAAFPVIAGAVYLVQPGDSLSQIAQTHCGKAADWTGIYAANKTVIGGDANLILPGQRLRLSCRTAAYTAPVVLGGGVSDSVYVAPARSYYAPVRVTVSGGSFQQCVISRESGGNPAAVNPTSGAGGLYQFLPSTWAALGHSGLPENASVAEQNQAFAQQYALSGTAAWSRYDGC